MTASILVTGAAGFIGSHTVDALLARGERVVGLDSLDSYYPVSFKLRNLAEIRERARRLEGTFEFIRGDIRDRDLLARLFTQHAPRAIVHLAAQAGVRASVADPWLYNDVNLTGTLNLLEAARAHGLPNFVFASTSSTFGTTARIPFKEDDPADRPLAPYPASKRAAEMLGHAYHHLHKIDFTALRFFTVYGPRGRPDMFAFQLFENLFRNRPLSLYRRGRVKRDWTYVSDIVAGIVAAVDVRLGYEILNVGRGEPVLLSDFVQAVEDCAGRRARLSDAPLPDSDVEITFADSSKAKRLLGYEPKVSVGEGAERMLRWYERTILTRPQPAEGSEPLAAADG